MLNATRLQLMNHFAYLQQFMASPRTVGTLAPSSPWLCQAMLNQVEWTGRCRSRSWARRTAY